jgi:hypothetical protein
MFSAVLADSTLEILMNRDECIEPAKEAIGEPFSGETVISEGCPKNPSSSGV